MHIDQTVDEHVGVVSLASTRANIYLKVWGNMLEAFVGCSLEHQSSDRRSSFVLAELENGVYFYCLILESCLIITRR